MYKHTTHGIAHPFLVSYLYQQRRDAMARSTRKCAIATCERTVVSHDLCNNHARRLLLYGDPLHVAQVQIHGTSLRERVFARIDTRGDCWLWTGYRNPQGYGKIQVQNHPELAHRIMWRLERGEIPEGQHVLHRCDNTSCVNPAHLFLGTQQDNVTDKMAKGRHRYGHVYGDAHGMAKLTEEQVREILASNVPGKQLAKQYGVSDTTIYDIRKRKIWRVLDTEATPVVYPPRPPLSSETREKLGRATRGKRRSETVRAKIAAAHRGKRLSVEHRAKLSAAHQGLQPWNAGVPMRVETKAKLAQTSQGNRNAARPVLVDGVRYGSGIEAMRATGLSRMQLTYRLRTGKAQYLDTTE
jgi:hypothetical protein